MKVESRQENGFLVISPLEDINIGGAVDFDRYLLQKTEKGKEKLILDFSRVGYIDSSGIGSIVRIHRHLKEGGGELILAGCNPNLMKIFQMINFQRYFRIVSTLEEAMTAK